MYTNKLDLPPVIAVEFWKGRLFDVGAVDWQVDDQGFTVECC
jgi:hypothetical protein